MKIIARKMVTKTFVDRIECDKCGIELKEDTFDTYEVEISTREHIPYEGFSTYKSTMDLCVTCKDALIALMVAAGYRLPDED